MKLHEDSQPFDSGAPHGASDEFSALGGYDYDLHFDDEDEEESDDEDDEDEEEYDEDGNEIVSKKEEELYGFSEESRE